MSASRWAPASPAKALDAIDLAPAHTLPAGGRRTATLALLAFAMLIVSLDQYIVVVALPEIGRNLGFSGRTLQLVVSAYAVASAGFLLLGGRSADRLGRRRVLVIGLALYASASAVGGLAAAPGVLLVARAIQGLGGALVFSTTRSVVNTTFAEGHERNRAVAVWGAAGAAGLVVGVLLGGVLTQTFGWEAVFLVNVPLAGGAIVLAFVLIPAGHDRVLGRGLDLPGALSVTLGLTALVFTLVEGPNLGWSSPTVMGGAAASLLLLTTFAAIGRRSSDPLVSPRLVSNRNLRTAMAVAFLFWATFGSVLYLLTIYFQDVHGYQRDGGRHGVPAPHDGRGRGIGPRRSAGHAVRSQTHPGRRARCRGTRSRRHRALHVSRRLLHRARSWPDRDQYRRRHRVHHDVHRRRYRRVSR